MPKLKCSGCKLTEIEAQSVLSAGTVRMAERKVITVDYAGTQGIIETMKVTCMVMCADVIMVRKGIL